MPMPLALVVEAIVLKSLFSIKGLAVAARAVASALSQGDLAGCTGAGVVAPGRATDRRPGCPSDRGGGHRVGRRKRER